MYIELKNINKSFGDFQASKDVNFAIEKGKLVGLLGPSGSGKTTILRMLAGLEHQDSGDICINGNVVNDLPSSQRGIGFVFQNYALFPYLTVYDNIAYGLKIQKKDKKFIKQRVTELLDLVGLPGLEKRYPDQLSGGQRQRIALARALAPNPEVLLLDESAEYLADKLGLKAEDFKENWKNYSFEPGFSEEATTHLEDIEKWGFEHGSFPKDYNVRDFINTDVAKIAFPDNVTIE